MRAVKASVLLPLWGGAKPLARHGLLTAGPLSPHRSPAAYSIFFIAITTIALYRLNFQSR